MPATRARSLAGLADRISEYVEWAGGVTIVAKYLGVTTNDLEEWANGYKAPSALWLCRMALFFGITPNELLGIRYTEGPEARRINFEREYGAWADMRKRHGLSMVVKPLPPRPMQERTRAP